MKLCRWLGSLAILAGLAALVGPHVLAQDKDKETTLVWKAFDFDKGAKPYYQTMAIETKQEMTVMGMTVKQNQNQTFYVSWTPQKPDDKGNWVVTQKIVGAKMDIDIGGNKISYDSTSENQPQNPLTDFFKALEKLDLKFIITPKMEVKSIEGNEQLIQNLGKNNPQMEPLLKTILSKEALTRMAEPPLYAFPTAPVKKGGKAWTKTSTLDLGPIGKYVTDYTFDYQGQDDKQKPGLDRISVKASMNYEPPKDKGAKLPFTIESDSQLKSESGTGFALFNTTKGRFDEYSLNMNLKGDLNIDIGGMKTKVGLKQEQTSKVTTSDTNPVDDIKGKKNK